ncbi:hypothetical protein TI04_05800 [Achromatium sp. WMS2]|nr:hypothetical protein TI04_05800 [Achromatium sp. WMS2]
MIGYWEIKPIESLVGFSVRIVGNQLIINQLRAVIPHTNIMVKYYRKKSFITDIPQLLYNLLIINDIYFCCKNTNIIVIKWL